MKVPLDIASTEKIKKEPPDKWFSESLELITVNRNFFQYNWAQVKTCLISIFLVKQITKNGNSLVYTVPVNKLF